MAYVYKISQCNLFCMFPTTFSGLTLTSPHLAPPPSAQNLLPLTPNQLVIHYLYYIRLVSPHTTTHQRITKSTPLKFVNHGCLLFF
jgi:hypothetical protein